MAPNETYCILPEPTPTMEAWHSINRRAIDVLAQDLYGSVQVPYPDDVTGKSERL
jgi:hypothetical protein